MIKKERDRRTDRQRQHGSQTGIAMFTLGIKGNGTYGEKDESSERDEERLK